MIVHHYDRVGATDDRGAEDLARMALALIEGARADDVVAAQARLRIQNQRAHCLHFRGEVRCGRDMLFPILNALRRGIAERLHGSRFAHTRDLPFLCSRRAPRLGDALGRLIRGWCRLFWSAFGNRGMRRLCSGVCRRRTGATCAIG